MNSDDIILTVITHDMEGTFPVRHFVLILKGCELPTEISIS